MAEPARRLWTLDEFLAFDDGTDTRYELFDGQIVAMAPTSDRRRCTNAAFDCGVRSFGSASHKCQKALLFPGNAPCAAGAGSYGTFQLGRGARPEPAELPRGSPANRWWVDAQAGQGLTCSRCLPGASSWDNNGRSVREQRQHGDGGADGMAVRLEGHRFDLDDLSRWFSQLDHKVRSEDGKYYLTSAVFEHCTTSTAVWELADQIVERINGAAKAFSSDVFARSRSAAKSLRWMTTAAEKWPSRGGSDAMALGQVSDGAIECQPPRLPLLHNPPDRRSWWRSGKTKVMRVDLGRALRIGLLPQQTGGRSTTYTVIKHDIGRNRRLESAAPSPPERA